MSIEHGVIKQIAYVVDDLDAAIQRWVEVVRAGPFFRIDGVNVADVRYRGQPVEMQGSLAVGNSGGVQIELIAVQGGAPSIYRERLGGVHHLAYLARDFEGESRRLEALGHPVAWALTLPGICRVNYHDTLAAFGHFLEIWESTEAMRGLLEMVETAARGWDGREPIRRLGLTTPP
jgi:methylmalonyl-CoA/ethylmalonyl-CoA epimerase